MTDKQVFTNRTKALKTIFFIMTLVLGVVMILSIGYAIWEMSPLSAESTYTVAYDTDHYGNRTNTIIYNDSNFVNLEFSRDLMVPLDTFIVSTEQAVVNLIILVTILRLPILIGLWWTYLIFKTLSLSRTPFEPNLFNGIKRLGKLFILYGLFGNLIFGLMLAIFVTGIVYINNPVNFYVILLGLVLYVVSEIMVYGFGLQTEVDTLL